MRDADLFLSYHGPDREAVQAVRQALAARGVSTFLDRNNLIAGLPWPQALEDALGGACAVAVFLGPHGQGLWQKREIGFALDRQVQEERAGGSFPVVPIVLPGADPGGGFLSLNTWVDLRHDLTDPEALDALERAVRGTGPAPPVDGPTALCPFRGLRPFYEEQAALFFGRESFAARLLETVSSCDLVAVIGTSGSGKSSVVQAGLVPLLRRQRPPASAWDAVTFTPGERPFHRLATALIPLLEPGLRETDRLAEAQKLGDHLERREVLPEAVIERLLKKSGGTDRLLVVVDQFEEFFTLTPTEGRQPFLDSLLQVLGRAPLSLLLTLRADFYGHLISQSRNLADRLERGVINLGPMTRPELERTIVEPARRAGLDLEAGLMERMLNDVGGEPGNLPLLEFALTELWTRRRNRSLTHAAYDAIGGVAGAVGRRAEEVLASLASDEQAEARRVLTRLVRIARPDEGGEDTRRRARVTDLSPGAEAVITALVEARLLVTGHNEAAEETVEVAHEALIRSWTRLRAWLNADREFLLWRQRLREDVAEWERQAHDEGALLRGARLTEAERWLGDRADELSPVEWNYIGHSVAERDRPLPLKPHHYPLWVLFFCASVFISALVSASYLPEYFGAALRLEAAETALQRGNFDNAISLYKEVLAIDDTSKAAKLGIAVALFSNKSRLDDEEAFWYLADLTLYEHEWKRLSAVMPEQYKALFVEKSR